MNAKQQVRMWVGAVAILGAVVGSARAAVDTYSVTLFNQTNPTLSSWTDKALNNPPLPSQVSVASESGNSFLRLQDMGYEGIIAPLSQLVTVNGLVSNIVVQGRVRANDTGNVGPPYPMQLALTSRTSPDPTYGYPYDPLNGDQANSISVEGWGHPNPVGNELQWRTNAVGTVANSGTPFLSSWNTWYDWKLVFDRPAGTLAFYLDNAGTPLLTQTGVNLDGATLQSLYLKGPYTGGVAKSLDYDNLLVTAEFFYTPEPSTAGLLALGAAVLAWRRRARNG
jgi:hypothetical protein